MGREKSYSEKLKDPRWQKKRLEIFNRDNWKCTSCRAENKTLHIHHKAYQSGLEPWEYRNDQLATLCDSCHKREHEQIIDPVRKYEHLIDYSEPPEVINSLNIQIGQLQNKLKEDISDELTTEILGNIIFIRNKIKELITAGK